MLTPSLPSLPVTLICPSTSLPNKTATMYSSLTRAHYSDGGVTRRMIQILVGGQFIGDSLEGLMHNAFEPLASQAFIDLGWLLGVLNGVAPGRFHLSGAGPALFSLPSDESEYQRVADALHPYGVGVYLVHTCTPEPVSS